MNGFFWNSDGRRQIDAGEGTEIFVSISAAIFELSRKSSKGGAEFALPRSGARDYGQIIPYISLASENTLLSCGAV